MSELTLALLAFTLVLCVADWQWGVLFIAVSGVLQETIRKAVPGEPVYVVLLVGVVFTATVAGKYLRHGNLGYATLVKNFPGFKGPLLFVLLWLTMQHVVTLVRFQSIPLLGLGVISYFFPLLAVALGFSFALKAQGSGRPVRGYIVLYCALVTAAASGIPLEFFGVESELFRQVGTGIMLYDDTGVVKTYCGFFRSPEIAAWHTGTALCLILSLASAPSTGRLKAVAVTVAPLLVFAAILTGRRKVIMVVMLFIVFFWFLQVSLRQSRRSYYPAALLVLGVVAGLYAGNFFDFSSPRQKLGSYLRRGGTVFADAPERFSLLGVQSVWWAINDFGVFGIGAGVLGQGGQYFGGGGEVFGGSGEGGLGKITGELGLPGLLLFGWIALVAVRQAAKLLRAASALGPEHRHLTVGLIALLAANVPGFIVASQAYGDPFIILSLGLFAGFAGGITVGSEGAEAAGAGGSGHDGEGREGGAGENAGTPAAGGVPDAAEPRERPWSPELLPPRPWGRV